MKQKEKVCSYCGRKFVGAAKARYCSDACKMKAYRRRLKVKSETV